MNIALRTDVNSKLKDLSRKVMLYVNDNNISLDKIVDQVNEVYLNCDSKDKEYYRGFFDSLMSMIELKTLNLNKAYNFQECFKKTKYSYFIIKILLGVDYINHSSLAMKLGMNVNQLSNIIRIVSNYGLVSTQKVGRKKYYFITDTGEDFYKYFIKNNDLKLILKTSKPIKKSDKSMLVMN